MKNRFLAVVSAISAVALVSGILVVTANAHIGASHSPYETTGPDLVSATLDGRDGVTYCFDDNVAEEGTAGEYFVTGYDADGSLYADDVDLGTTDECVDATFDTGTANDTIEDFTVAGVDTGDEIENRAGDPGVEAVQVVALDDSLAPDSAEANNGTSTAAPDLVSFEVHDGADTISYFFDENLSCDGSEDESLFGFYDSDFDDPNTGTPDANNTAPEYGDSIETCDENELEVGFTGTDVTDAEKVFYDESGNGDPAYDYYNNSDLQAEGQVDGIPDLTDVERTDDDTWTYSFDEDIHDDSADIDFTKFWLTNEDGSQSQADDCDADESNTVECSFDGDEYSESQDFEFPSGSVDECAVVNDEDLAADQGCNTVGDAPAAVSDEGSGNTDAPDLEECDLGLPEDELGQFTYDERVDEDATFDENDFWLLDKDGEFIADGVDMDDVEDAVVSIEFDQDDLEDAVVCVSDDAAVQDYWGNTSIEAAVGAGTAESPTPSTSVVTSTSTSTSTVTTGTGHTPVKRKIATNLTIRYDRDAHAFKGSVGSSKKKCQTGRLVRLHEKGQGVKGSDSSNKKGNYLINSRNAQGKFFTEVAKKVFTAKNGDTIVCKTDTSPTIKV
jgi:hypothetical protein